MRIIEQKQAPNPRRVRIFLAEKGITVPFEQIDIIKGEAKAAAYTAMNPLQQVPTLVLDDGTAISESIAICRYFEETNPTPPLFGTGAKGRALVEMWSRRTELGFFWRVSQVFRHSHPAMKELEVPQVAAIAETSKPKVGEFLVMMDRELASRPFVAGDAFSVADITLLVGMDFMKPGRITRPEGLANLERWYAAVNARPSAKA